jgi:hypothetical protein
MFHGPLRESGMDWSWDVVDIGILGLEKTRGNQQSSSSNNDEDFVHFVYYFISIVNLYFDFLNCTQ